MIVETSSQASFETLKDMNNRGSFVYVKGKVIQVVGDDIRIYVTETNYGNCKDDIYVHKLANSVKTPSYIWEDDIVVIYGVVASPESYETVRGTVRTVPRIDAYIIDVE